MKYISKISAKVVIRSLIVGLTVLSIAACSDGIVGPNGEPSVPTIQGDSVTIRGSILLPEMPVTLSRGDAADTPGANLNLTLLEFNLSDDADYSFPTNNYRANITSATNVPDGTEVTFEVTLKLTSDPKSLQLLIGGNYFSVGDNYMSMSSLLPSFSVEGRLTGLHSSFSTPSEAYWGKVNFEKGYSEMKNGKPVLLDEVKTLLKRVPVIRNFAKISVTNSVPTKFEILGWELINVPTSGTVVPWNLATKSPATLANGYTMLNYDAITQGGYEGIMPANVLIGNTEAEAKLWPSTGDLWMSTNPRFIYEHPYESTRRTYLIIQGRYTSTSNGTTSSATGFYKVDIGKLNNGLFNYYNIIRNIHYQVSINDVLAPGAETIAEAIARAPFNNLLSSTETSTMLNVSDGNNMLMVNDTNHIIVDENSTIEIMYRYVQDVTGTKNENNNAITKDMINWGEVPGPVIKSVSDPTTFTDPITKWNWVKYVITPQEPSDEVKTQDISIVDGSGLGRIIHLVLRNPWEYAKIGTSNNYATVQPGTDNMYSAAAAIAPQPISNQAEKTLTVYFNLPEGLPETMFPLEFKLESQHQGIENNKIGTLLVQTGQSLWDPKKTAISYVKTVSYSEYRYQYYAGTNDVDPNSTNTTHTVRCRFKTIAASDNNSDAAIRIYNPYFFTIKDGTTSPYADVSFKRVSTVTQ